MLYDPDEGILTLIDPEGRYLVLGTPTHVSLRNPPGKVYCVDGEFYCGPGRYRIDDFYKLKTKARIQGQMFGLCRDSEEEVVPLSDLGGIPVKPGCPCNEDECQIGPWDESEHERTGGPAYCTEGCCAIPGEREATIYDNTPLQEQVEQQDKHIFQLEDALSKSVDVIAALCAERKDLTEQVYQAQVDAQDWQNKYNEAKRLQHPNTWREAEDREWDALLADRDMFRGQAQYWQNKYNSLAKAYDTLDADLTKDFTATITSLRDEVDAEKEKHFDYENLRTRVYQLTHDNTQLELRNDRQGKRLNRILATVQGLYDKYED